MMQALVGISSMATRAVLMELADLYERRSTQRVIVESVGGVHAARRVRAGESFDFVVLAADAIDGLAASGHIDPTTRTDVAQSGVAIGIKAGAAKPDVATEAAVRDAVLNARRIGYSTGPSGLHLARLFDRWGIADAIASRVVQAPPGVPVATLIARGDVDIGFQQLSELMHVPGVAVIGLMPAPIQSLTVFCGAVCSVSRRAGAARGFLSFVASQDADAVKRRHGMDPAMRTADCVMPSPSASDGM